MLISKADRHNFFKIQSDYLLFFTYYTELGDSGEITLNEPAVGTKLIKELFQSNCVVILTA